MSLGDTKFAMIDQKIGVMTMTPSRTFDVNGDARIVTDLYVGDDLSLVSDSAIINMGAGNDVTFTHDGTTGLVIAATPISINSTGDLTLDSSTDIVLDAAGGNIEFKDAGTLQLTLDMDTTSGAQIVKLGVDSDDLIFQQYDGNEVVRIADDRRLYFYDKGGEHIAGDGTNLIITSGQNIILGAAVSSAVVPATDNNVDLGSTSKRWANLYTGDLHLKNERGDWTIIEESEYLTVTNNANGKRYKIMMEEIED